MSDLKELIQGKIYYFKYRNEQLETLIRLNSPGFPLIEKSKKITATFHELAKTHYPVYETIFHTPMIKLIDRIKRDNCIMYEVPLKDLPLYIYMPIKNPAFLDLIRGTND